MLEAVGGPGLPATGVRRTAYLAGWSAVFVGLLWLLTVLPLYTLRGTESGPRWLAGNDLIIYAGVLPMFVGGLTAALTSRRRNVWYLIADAVLTFVIAAVVLELPNALVDAFGPFEERVIEVVEWTTSDNGTARIRTADGATLSGPNAFGVVKYKAMPSGTYDVLLTAATHTVVAATPRR